MINSQIEAQLKQFAKEEGWQHEFKHAGLQCLMIRNPRYLSWCGYVAVPMNSILNEVKYWINEPEKPHEKAVNDIDVHGGLTFSGKIEYIHEPCKIFDINNWVFGFDCCHLGDLFATYHGEYRNKEYVIEQCKKLAEQLSKILKDYGNDN